MRIVGKWLKFVKYCFQKKEAVVGFWSNIIHLLFDINGSNSDIQDAFFK